MASTNKTTHYDLSQYTASDKPTYLVDYNTDMSNIDTGIYNAQSKANTNESSIGTLSNLETTAKTNLVSAINELKGKTDGIGNLSNLTTESQSNLVGAINEVDAHADANNQNIGTMTNLETTVKTSLVGAINEVNSNVGNPSNLNTTAKTNLVSAINEVNSKNDVYSTTETVTNKTWINGKPIYRKVITGTITNSGWNTIDTEITNFEDLIDLHTDIGAVEIYANNFYLGDNYECISRIQKLTNVTNLQINLGAGYVNSPFKAIIEYTKSTD